MREGMVEFQAQVTGHKTSEKAVFFKELLGLTDWKLAVKCDHRGGKSKKGMKASRS